MARRKEISASLRWSVFSRDGFCCRYCGGQAGENGVELVVDHLVSVAEGGDNRMDNLVSACQRCNGGKGARSLQSAPAPEEVVRRTKDRAANLAAVSESMEAAIAAKKQAAQQVVNLKCEAYDVDSIRMNVNEEAIAAKLVVEFGADRVLEWYTSAVSARVNEWNAIKYVCGCARRAREEREGRETDAQLDEHFGIKR